MKLESHHNDDRSVLNTQAAILAGDPDIRRHWLSIPEDVMAGIFEEVQELLDEGSAESHWAWQFVAPALAVH